MPSAPENQKQLFSDLFFERISEDEFLEKFQKTRENISPAILEMLNYGLKEKASDAVEDAIPLMYRFGISKEYLEVLNSLAEEPWHHRHEDVVFALGKIKDPSSVDILARTAVAKHPYLEDDEAFALGTKSIYALKNIQTPEAIEKLGQLARNENDVLRTTAIGRLKDIAKKGESETARAVAQSVLDG
jgi:HEAT repeat protein